MEIADTKRPTGAHKGDVDLFQDYLVHHYKRYLPLSASHGHACKVQSPGLGPALPVDPPLPVNNRENLAGSDYGLPRWLPILSWIRARPYR